MYMMYGENACRVVLGCLRGRLVAMGEGHEPRDEQGGNGAYEHEHEEMAVAQGVAHHATHHSRQHDAKVHNARSEGVMAHLVLAGRYLLHHEEGQAYEAEAITEVFEHDTAAYEHEALGLVKGQQGVGHEGKVEHQGQRKEAFLQSPACDVVAGDRKSVV